MKVGMLIKLLSVFDSNIEVGLNEYEDMITEIVGIHIYSKDVIALNKGDMRMIRKKVKDSESA